MTQQTETLRNAVALAAAGLIPPERVAELERVAARYAVSLTPDMAALIDRSDPNDPMARQFVPTTLELVTTRRSGRIRLAI